MTDSPLKDLSYISRAVGRHPAYVQGGGGNTSVKMDGNLMAIKASGYLLSDVTEEDGFSVVDYKAIRDYLDNPDNSEDAFVQRIKSMVVDTINRPSIETGFHVLLDDYVIHTHSVYANILTCSQEGKALAEKLFPDALWITYATPGRELTLKIRDAIAQHPCRPEIIFLQNHGIIVTGKTSTTALDSHDSLNNTIQKFFGIDQNAFDSWDTIMDFDYVKEHVLFPDQVVYTSMGQENLTSLAATQTLLAYSFIISTIEQKRLTARFIDQKFADILANMESEKYRVKLMQNKEGA